MSISRDTIYTIQMLSGTSSDEKPTDVKSGSTFKEIDTGKTYIYDGSTWVLQPGAGGASDPVLENAKSTGGIGWTEQGEQTVITWDGDTEGKVTAELLGSTLYVKVAEAIEGFDPQSVSKATIFGFGEVEPTAVEVANYGFVMYQANEAFPAVYVYDFTKTADSPYGAIPENGFYFFYVDESTYTSSLTYGTPDTVHKIDEKYLPGTVVEFVLDETMSAVESASKTIVEVRNAMLTGPVVGVVKASRDGQEIVNPVGCATTDKRGNPAFSCYYDADNSSWVETIGVEDHEWAFKVESSPIN